MNIIIFIIAFIIFLLTLAFNAYIAKEIKKLDEISTFLAVVETPINTIIIVIILVLTNFNIVSFLFIQPLLYILYASITYYLKEKDDKYFEIAFEYQILRNITAYLSIFVSVFVFINFKIFFLSIFFTILTFYFTIKGN